MQRPKLFALVCLLTVANVAVRVLPVGWLARWVVGARGRRSGCREDAELLAAAVADASRRCRPCPTCLAQSLVLAGLFARRGLDAALVLGVAKCEGRLVGHAWVEHGERRYDAQRSGLARSGFAELFRVDRRGLVRPV